MDVDRPQWVDSCGFATTLSNRRNRLASRPREGLNVPSQRNDSATIAPCFTAFLLPFRAPPPAPCIRHTSAPRTAGASARQPAPLRCRMTSQRLVHGPVHARPHPLWRGVDVADDRLPALGDTDVLDRHLLLALGAIFLQRYGR